MALASMFYLIIGLPTSLISVVFAALGSYIGLTPIFAVKLALSGFPDGSPSKFTWVFPYLHAVAMVCSIIVLYSLIKLKNNPKLIMVLYAAIVASWAIAASNIFILLNKSGMDIRIFLSLIHPIITFISVKIIARNKISSPPAPVEPNMK